MKKLIFCSILVFVLRGGFYQDDHFCIKKLQEYDDNILSKLIDKVYI